MRQKNPETHSFCLFRRIQCCSLWAYKCFTFIFYDLLSWAPINKTLEAHLLYLRHFSRILNKALAPWSELLHNIFMDLKTGIYSDFKDLRAWGKKDLMHVIYRKHVRLIPLFIDGNNLLIIAIQLHPYYLYILYNIIYLYSAMVYQYHLHISTNYVL